MIDPRIGCKVLVSVKRMVLCFAEFFFQSSSVFTIGYLGGKTGLNLNNFHSDAHGHGQLSLRLHDLHPNGHRFCRSDLVQTTILLGESGGPACQNKREQRPQQATSPFPAQQRQHTSHLYWPPGPHRHIGAAETLLASTVQGWVCKNLLRHSQSSRSLSSIGD